MWATDYPLSFWLFAVSTLSFVLLLWRQDVKREQSEC